MSSTETPPTTPACHGCGAEHAPNFSELEHVRYCDDCVKGYAAAGTDVSDIWTEEAPVDRLV